MLIIQDLKIRVTYEYLPWTYLIGNLSVSHYDRIKVNLLYLLRSSFYITFIRSIPFENSHIYQNSMKFASYIIEHDLLRLKVAVHNQSHHYYDCVASASPADASGLSGIMGY